MKKFIRRLIRSHNKRIYPRVPTWYAWSKARQRRYLQGYAQAESDRAQRFLERNTILRKRIEELEKELGKKK